MDILVIAKHLFSYLFSQVLILSSRCQNSKISPVSHIFLGMEAGPGEQLTEDHLDAACVFFGTSFAKYDSFLTPWCAIRLNVRQKAKYTVEVRSTTQIS